MKFSLKSKLSLSMALLVLLTVALISFLSNFFIQHEFKDYISGQQKRATEEIADNISAQYDKTSDSWNVDFIHTIGMYALYDGYIIKVHDSNGGMVWDAEACDMKLCASVMDDVSNRTMNEYPEMNGKFATDELPLMQGKNQVGTVNVGYFGPFFLSEDDFLFLKALNRIFLAIGALSLMISVITGILLARHLSRPILKTVEVTKDISDGKYSARIEGETGTKEVDQLIGSINQLAQSLEKQELLRKQMTADVAHELRTPLTTVQTHIEAILEGVWEPTTERLQSCYDEMNRLSILISDLENLARVESDNFKLNKTEANLLELAGKALLGFEKEFSQKDLRATVEGDCSHVLADKDRISQVLINLISNSAKYTPEGGKIKITLSETTNLVNIQIEDTGMGIPDDELPYIFERFYRADKSRNRKTGGSGIGLAIVKSIVSAHGGRVEVRSKIDEGSCFDVILPRNPKPSQ